MFTVVAPASTTAATISVRNSGSVREASSGENSTSSQASLAMRTASTARRTISSRAISSLNLRWISLVATNTWMRLRDAGSKALADFSMSPSWQRASEQMVTPRMAWAISRTDSKSPGEAAAKPASMMSTRISRSARATLSFSRNVMLQPGACSPSRKVVSKMRTRSWVVCWFMFPLS